MRSCRILLCFRLCSSACGTPTGDVVMKTAVPGTRVAAAAADLMNTSIGIELSRSRSCISARPRDQVVRPVKPMMPITNGNQPPSGTLVRLDAK